MNVKIPLSFALPPRTADATASPSNRLKTGSEAKVQEPMPSRAPRHDTRAPRLGQEFNMRFLMLQQEMQMDNRKFTTLSNVMKTKHQTASAAISNIK